MAEKRLIEANALVDAIEDIDWYHVNAKGKLVDGANPANNTPIYKAFDIYNAIKNAPTVDAVEVVLCKDCRYRIHDEVTNEWFCNSFHSGFVYAKPNDFCSYGERKDNNG